MARPALEVADIFRDHGAAWRLANRGHLSLDQLKLMSAIESCRTAALGGHVARCENDACGYTSIAYNSCLMGKFRNGELETGLNGNLTVFRALPRYSICRLLPIKAVPSRDSCVPRLRLGRLGYPAWPIAELGAPTPRKPAWPWSRSHLTPRCTASAQRPHLPSRQAERLAQGALVMESENSPNLRSIRCGRAPTPHYGFCP